MKIVEQAQAELSSLPASEVLIVYDLIHRLRMRQAHKPKRTRSNAYLRVRKALRGCNGCLSDDVARDREERA